MDMESPLLIGDPYINVLPYIETADASETTTTTSFSIELSAKFTRAPLDEDSDDDETLIFDDTGLESVIISRDLPLSLDVLKNDNDENDHQFRAALDAFLAEVHVPSSLISSMLTDGIVECGRTMWKDRVDGFRYRVLCVRVNLDMFVDVLPPGESYYNDYDDDDDDDDYEEEEEEEEVVDGDGMAFDDIGFVAASETAIEDLERVRIADDRVAVSCSVCFEKVSAGSEASRLPCSHSFHGDCIVKWLQTSKFCSLCRFELPNN